MNTAATLAFVTVMFLGMGGLTTLVWRDRRRTTPLAGDSWEFTPLPLPPSATIYDATVHALGDPAHIDFTAHPIAW